MDFDLSRSQRGRLDLVGLLIDDAGADADIEELDDVLLSSNVLSGATALDRFLIAEDIARRGVSSGFGLYGLVRDLLPDGLPLGRIAITESHRGGPVRFADSASVVVILDAERAYLHIPDFAQVEPVEAVFGYPFAHVMPTGEGSLLPHGAGDRIRARWRLTMVAEISGNARSAIDTTAGHLKSRVQFGRPLASFQALRHRLADAAVSAEATSWLGREAAFREDPRSILRAAWYASDTAASLVPELVQMCGARSFTLEFGLHLFTMRMNCLRLELGGIDRLGQELSSPMAK